MKKTMLSSAMLALAFLSSPLVMADAQGAPPVQRYTSESTYYIYYGAWTPTLLTAVQANGYKVVVVEPKNITQAQVADLQNGTDNVLGNADDMKVLGYISFGEDNRSTIYEPDPNNPGHNRIKTVAGGTGPKIDPRRSPNNVNPVPPISSIAVIDQPPPQGVSSPGGTGYASFYLDGHDTNADGLPEFDGKPDSNGEFGGAYVNAGDPAWYTVLKNMIQSVDGNCGLDEIMTTTVGKGLGADGIFTDTIDTCAPDSFAPSVTMFEWTAPGYRDLMKTVRNAYPTKFILQNRGTFFFRTDVEAYNFSTRPFIDGVFFESYYCDSNDFDTKSPYFNDNKWNVGKHINAEADRADGFTVFALNYLEPRATRATITVDGTVSDWPVGSGLQVNGSPIDGGAINNVAAANDSTYLYLRVSTDASTNLNSSNFNIYFDTDDVADSDDVSAAGYVPTGSGTRIKSELLYQWGGLYSQDTGAFNLGQVGTASVASDAGQTEWEIRIPRALVHPAGHPRLANQPVFGADGSHILLLLTYDVAGTTQYFPVAVADGWEKNLGYRFEQATPGSVFDDSLAETISTHGWLSYQTDKWLSQAPNTRATAYNSTHADSAAPVWSTTANGFVARGATPPNAARTGVQEVIAGSASATVRWDLADDQSRPVRYKIYYAPASPDPGTNLAAAPWQNTGYVSGTAPSNYKWGSWAANNTNIYANEYVVTGLTNGVQYKFVVRAADSAAVVHEDTNLTSLTATPVATSGSVYANIAVDGSFTDWPANSLVWSDPQSDNGTGPTDLKALYLANDANNIYVRVESWNAHNWPQATPLPRLYFDADQAVGDTAHNAFSLNQIYSELLMEGGVLYSQKDGSYAQLPSLQGVGIAPFGVSATNWEFSIPRSLQHLDATNVFSSNGFKMLANSGNNATDEFSAVVSYVFAQPPTGSTWASITLDGSFADWPAGAQIWSDPQGDQGTGASDLKALWIANDATNVYVRVESWNTHDWPQTLQRIYFDTDLAVGDTAHNAFGLGQIYSELLMEGGSFYSQKDGSYAQTPALQAALISPYAVQANSWEFSIPRNLQHLDATSVFTTTGFKMLANSGNNATDEFAGVVTYTFAAPPATPTPTTTPTPTATPTPTPTATPTVTPTPTPVQTTVTFNPVNAEDGDVLESGENTNVGGTVAATNTTIRIGDNNVKRQYRTVLSFDTSSLPDAAVIDNAVLTLTRTGVAGTPTTLGTIQIDIKTGNLGAASTLAVDDFAAAVTSANVGTLPYPATNVAVSSTLNAAGRTAVSKTAKTQLRVAFTTDDDNDSTADNLLFAAGEHGTAASRPKLVITYH